jgi:DNA-binding CsgD family transcriptional regulator
MLPLDPSSLGKPPLDTSSLDTLPLDSSSLDTLPLGTSLLDTLILDPRRYTHSLWTLRRLTRCLWTLCHRTRCLWTLRRRTRLRFTLAKEFGVGYSYFRREFKKQTGFSLKQYQIELRLRRVKDLLQREALSIKEIAEQLGIGFDTVRTHIRRIYEKLQVHSRAQAVAKFVQPDQLLRREKGG